ncbi:MAG: hypothetical protein PHN78_01450 [Dehalococcoidales bacterium]|nr:hypothetical protein [Dehalococcoidales bacterium]
MEKKWQIIAALVLSLVTVITAAAPVLAQEGESGITNGSSRGALAIIAPWSAPVGGEFTVRAFLRENQEPFPGAGVWAVDTEKMATLKEELGQFKQEFSQTDIESDYESVLNIHCSYLGRTGGDGRLACTIEQAGTYILVAARNGYMPGFTHISIREAVKSLGIRVPKRVPLGEEVTIAVFERLTQDTVDNAGVWAVTRDKVEALKQEAQELKEDTSLTAEEKDYEALANRYGLFLGRTDEHGELDYTFKEAGGYLMVAVKRGYMPVFASLTVYEKPAVLGIKATPPRSHIGKEVRLNVFDRENNEPIGDAGVWAINRDKAAILKEEVAAFRKDTGTTVANKDYEAAISLHSDFLGRTDNDGTLRATFTTAGDYLLVTAKKGYIPGFTSLAVRDMPESKTAESTTQELR